MSQENVELVYRWYEAMRRRDKEACVRDSEAEHGDTVIAQIRMTGRGASSGLPIEQTTWQVTWFRNGKLAGFTAYGSRAEALEAVGLSE